MSSPNEYPEIEKMRAGVAYRMPIKVRGFEIQVRPLAISEQMQATTNAIDKFRALPEPAKHKLSESAFMAIEMLKLATTSDYGANDSSITEESMKLWTSQELMYVYDQYLQAIERANPSIDKMPPEQLKEIVEELKKKPKGELFSVLTELSFSTLREVAESLLTPGD